MSGQVMTRKKWAEFLDRLAGPEGCNFRGETPEDRRWNCAGPGDQSSAKRILAAMGLSEGEIVEVLAYCDQHGGHCDCTIVFNVPDSLDVSHLYPLIEHAVQTPQGSGRLVQVFADRCAVVFDSRPPRLEFFNPAEIQVMA